MDGYNYFLEDICVGLVFFSFVFVLCFLFVIGVFAGLGDLIPLHCVAPIGLLACLLVCASIYILFRERGWFFLWLLYIFFPGEYMVFDLEIEGCGC